MSRTHSGLRGFTLLELVVVIAILAILAGILTPIAKSAIDDSRAAKITTTFDSLSKACQKYYFDNSAVAVEHSDSTTATNRNLTTQPSGMASWKGPYTDKPLSNSDNPFGSAIRVLNSLDAATPGAGGFDLLGTGTPNRTGTGNCLRIADVPATIAQLVNDSLDRGVPGTWSSTGVVEYDSTNQVLYMFILDTDNS